MEIIINIMWLLLILNTCYWIYQWKRNDATYKIVMKWIEEDDPRYYLYDYYFIYEPKKENWYGLKFPNEKYYQ